MTRRGRHFLQIPGPTNTPDRILRAMAAPTIDHRGAGVRRARPRGAGRAEDRLSDGVAGRRSTRRRAAARGKRRSSTRCRLATRCWRSTSASSRRTGPRSRAGSASTSRSCPARGAAASIRTSSASAWRDDRDHRIKAVLVVHNETSTGVTTRLPEIRRAIDAREASGAAARRRGVVAGVDRSRHDEWGLDVTLSGSQKGLMLPPGLSFNAISAEGAGGVEDREVAALLLGVGRDARRERQRLLSDDARDEPAVRPARSAAHAGRGRSAGRVRAASPAGRGDARGRARPGSSRFSASATTSSVRWSRPS